MRRLRLTLDWYSRTQGETPVTELLHLGRERLFSPAALAVVDSARRQPGLSSDEALAPRFLRRRLAGEHVSLRAARFDDAAGAASADAVVRVSFDSQPIPLLDLPLRQAAESNAARRGQLATAASRVMLETLNPILRQKHAAVQAAARAVGYRDYVAMSEDLRDVALDSLLASGVAYGARRTRAVARAGEGDGR